MTQHPSRDETEVNTGLRSRITTAIPRLTAIAGPAQGRAFAMANASAGAISVRPQASGTASGAMGFLQMGFGAICSQVGAYLGGHFVTPLPLNIAILTLSSACAAAIIFLVPRRNTFVSAETMIEAEEQDAGVI